MSDVGCEKIKSFKPSKLHLMTDVKNNVDRHLMTATAKNWHFSLVLLIKPFHKGEVNAHMR